VIQTRWPGPRASAKDAARAAFSGDSDSTIVEY
jgi:hypothetical protein